MPLYDYGCEQCGHVQEETHSIKESPQIECQCCGSVMVRHICTNPQIVFKGEGWASKTGRVAGQMRNLLAKAEKQESREWSHLKGSRVVPNVDGDVVGEPGDARAWREAGRLAAERGYNAATYEQKAQEIEQRQVMPDHLKDSRAFIGGAAGPSSPAGDSRPVTQEQPIQSLTSIPTEATSGSE